MIFLAHVRLLLLLKPSQTAIYSKYLLASSRSNILPSLSSAAYPIFLVKRFVTRSRYQMQARNIGKLVHQMLYDPLANTLFLIFPMHNDIINCCVKDTKNLAFGKVLYRAKYFVRQVRRGYSACGPELRAGMRIPRRHSDPAQHANSAPAFGLRAGIRTPRWHSDPAQHSDSALAFELRAAFGLRVGIRTPRSIRTPRWHSDSALAFGLRAGIRTPRCIWTPR